MTYASRPQKGCTQRRNTLTGPPYAKQLGQDLAMTEPILEGVGDPIRGENGLTRPGSPGRLSRFDEDEGKIGGGGQGWVGDSTWCAYFDAPIPLADQPSSIDCVYVLNPWINQYEISLIG
jgi:hypothetical protein